MILTVAQCSLAIEIWYSGKHVAEQIIIIISKIYMKCGYRGTHLMDINCNIVSDTHAVATIFVQLFNY